jgi:iron complex outermembrane receptor protein
MMKSLIAMLFAVLFMVDAAGQNTIQGRVFDENKEPIVGASVLISGTKNGVVTDFDGNFNLNTSKPYPVIITIQFIGYSTLELEVPDDLPIIIQLAPDSEVLKEVNIVERRLSQKQQESALTVEAMDVLAIRETPAVNFYEGLGNLKGVDLTSASIGFKIINTRGFNSTSPVRSLQIIDGVDNQAPGLNFSLGNFLGASELDVMNVDIIAGASTAFYGPNAFNGVISMTTKSPYEFKGLSASVKYGERNLTEFAVRWADAIKNKKGEERFAYKINVFWLQADDWEANNLNAVDESNNTDSPTPASNPGGYDAVNRYGDEQIFDDGGLSKTYPGLGTYHRSGIEEIHLVDYDTRNLKIGTSLHYRFKPDLELSYSFNYGTGTTVYQGDNRFSLKGIQFYQNRLELRKKNKWFVRAYATNEDAGESYDAYFTALQMQESVINDQAWGVRFRDWWGVGQFGLGGVLLSRYADSVTMHPNYPAWADTIFLQSAYRAVIDQMAEENPEDFRRWHRNLENQVNLSGGMGQALTPGTPEFNALFNDIIGKTFAEGGSRLFDRSALYHAQGEYQFDPTNVGQFVVGGNGRLYRPNSNGTIFSDTNGVVISNYEFGAYAGWERRFLDDRLKLNATARLDKNQNFDFLPTAAISGIMNVDELNTVRVSFSSAIRNPTLQDQYLYYNTGPALLVGNLSGYQDLVQVDRIRDFLAAGTSDRADFDWMLFDVDPIRPERVQTVEAGYRTTLFDAVYVDMNYYFSWYQDFIGFNIVGEGIDTNEIINPFNDLQILRIASNAQQQVTTQGFSIGLNYYFAKHFTLSGNYTWNVLNTDVNDPIVPAFNTPENKFNISWGGRDMKVNQSGSVVWGFNVTYKWVQGFRFEGSPQFTGFIDAYDMLDAQLNMRIKEWNTTVKIGSSNVLNNLVYQVYGGPQVGRLAYVSVLYDWIKN